MTDEPDMPDVVSDDPAGVLGTASLVLWTELVRRLVDKGVLSKDDVQTMIKATHDEFAKKQGAGSVMALLARLAMNV